MIYYRKDIEDNEAKILAPYAFLSKNSKWRKYKETEDKFRTCFQRDKDRVLHSKSYRRLVRKTQVFPSTTPKDHVRNRFIHTNEVEQIWRGISRSLWLNEDLTELIAKCHDLWHTPYGHAGQDALDYCLSGHWLRFEHNIQSRRILESIESRSDQYNWLNLSYEILEWLWKHESRQWFEQGALPYLEAQVVNIADLIAYLSSDLDDAIRSNIIKVWELENLEIWKLAIATIGIERIDKSSYQSLIWNLIWMMMEDLLYNSSKLLELNWIKSQKDVEISKKVLIKFSDVFYLQIKELRDFLFSSYYNNKFIIKKMNKWKLEIKFLFDFFIKNSEQMPEKYKQRVGSDSLPRCVADYISWMTDRYANSKYKQYVNF